MQYSGNFLLVNQYRTSYYWATNTDGNDGSLLYLQDDGNLVIKSALGDTVWATYTSANCKGLLQHCSCICHSMSQAIAGILGMSENAR